RPPPVALATKRFPLESKARAKGARSPSLASANTLGLPTGSKRRIFLAPRLATNRSPLASNARESGINSPSLASAKGVGLPARSKRRMVLVLKLLTNSASALAVATHNIHPPTSNRNLTLLQKTRDSCTRVGELAAASDV